jgi:hypothetical protein
MLKLKLFHRILDFINLINLILFSKFIFTPLKNSFFN